MTAARNNLALGSRLTAQLMKPVSRGDADEWWHSVMQLHAPVFHRLGGRIITSARFRYNPHRWHSTPTSVSDAFLFSSSGVSRPVNKTPSGFQAQLSTIFAQLTWLNIHHLPWAWCVKRTPSRVRYWALHQLFRVGYSLALAWIATLRFARRRLPEQSDQSLALVLVLRSVARFHTQTVLGKVERFRKSILAIISPSDRDDLVARGLPAGHEPSSAPRLIWIAHGSMTPEACRRVVFYIHGGGFVKGDLAAFHHACSALSRKLCALVAFPLYPLCPEKTIVQAVSEICTAYQRVRRELPSAEPILMADSAGGLLAALMLRSLHKKGIPLPSALVLLSPLLDIDLTSASAAQTSARDPVIDFELLAWLCSLARQNVDPVDIMLDWTNLAYFPRTLIVASDSEILRGDSQRLEAALLSQHVPVQAAYWPGQLHAFPLLHDYLPESRRATDDIRSWLDDECHP